MENKYIVYIDESNILSKTGNSVYTAVYVKFLNKDYLAHKIINTERELRISHTHWSDMSWKIRLKFSEHIKSVDFICKIIIYKNPIKQETILEQTINSWNKRQLDLDNKLKKVINELFNFKNDIEAAKRVRQLAIEASRTTKDILTSQINELENKIDEQCNEIDILKLNNDKNSNTGLS